MHNLHKIQENPQNSQPPKRIKLDHLVNSTRSHSQFKIPATLPPVPAVPLFPGISSSSTSTTSSHSSGYFSSSSENAKLFTTIENVPPYYNGNGNGRNKRRNSYSYSTGPRKSQIVSTRPLLRNLQPQSQSSNSKSLKMKPLGEDNSNRYNFNQWARPATNKMARSSQQQPMVRSKIGQNVQNEPNNTIAMARPHMQMAIPSIYQNIRPPPPPPQSPSCSQNAFKTPSSSQQQQQHQHQLQPWTNGAILQSPWVSRGQNVHEDNFLKRSSATEKYSIKELLDMLTGERVPDPDIFKNNPLFQGRHATLIEGIPSPVPFSPKEEKDPEEFCSISMPLSYPPPQQTHPPPNYFQENYGFGLGQFMTGGGRNENEENDRNVNDPFFLNF